MRKLLFTVFAAMIAAGAHAQIITLWDDQAPSGGGMELVATNEVDALGIDTGRGDIGVFDAPVAAGDYKNYNTGVQDWSAYAGKGWTFTVDIYITAAQLAVVDDTIYWSVGGGNGGHTDINTLTADTWNTVTMSGTFNSDAGVMATANFLLLNNDKGTDPAGPIYYIDNFKLEVDTATRFSVNDLSPRAASNPDFWISGTPGVGEIIVHPDATNTWRTTDGNINPPELKLRWQGIDINGNGSTNDYFDFTLRIDASTGSTTLRNIGIGDNWKLNGTDSLICTVKDIAVSASAGGTIEFEGFTSAGLYCVDYTDSMYNFTADLNGIPLSCVDTNPADPNGETYRLADGAFAPTNTLVCDNPVYLATDGNSSGSDAGHLRDFDLSFTWSTNVAPVYIDSTNVVDFLASEGFSSGAISGQVDWVEGSTNADFVVNASTGIATATNDNVNMTLIDPINGLKVGDTVSLTVDFSFLGTPEDISGTNDNFNGYFFNAGLTTQSTGEAIGAQKSYADATRLQRFFTTNSALTRVRMLNNAFGTLTGNMADLAADDDLQLVYSLTLGADAASSTIAVTLLNKTQVVSTSGSQAMTSTDVYDALVATNGGAYVYVEANTLLQGITGVEVDRVEIVTPKLYIAYDNPYDQWAFDNELAGGAGDDDDGDGLDNFGEWVFGGLPKNSADRGAQPSYDAAGGVYSYSVMGDTSLTVTISTKVNLTDATWTPVNSYTVTSESGTVDPLTENISADGSQLFIKLDVEQN